MQHCLEEDLKELKAALQVKDLMRHAVSLGRNVKPQGFCRFLNGI